MAKILALIDGSAYAQSVCDLAAWAATRTGAEVELLHVLGRREAGFTVKATLAPGHADDA